MNHPHDLGLDYPFPASTYRSRVTRLREKLAADGFDGVLLSSQASLYHLFGYDQIGYSVFQVVWLPTDAAKQTLGICRAPDVPLMSRSVGLDEVQVWWDDDLSSPAETVMSWVAATASKRVGIETGSHELLPRYLLELQGAATDAGVELADSRHALNLRERKEGGELEYVGAAAKALERGFTKVAEAIRPGVLDTQLSAVITSSLLEDGCDPSAVPHCIASGPRTLSQTHLSPKHLPITRGDVVTVEFGASVARYHAVGFRTFFTEKVPDAYEKQYSLMAQAVQQGLGVMRPGGWSNEVAEAVHDHLDDAGSSRHGRHVGYGIGIGFPPTWVEGLRIKRSDGYRLEPGMTFFLFVGAPTADGERYLGYGDPVAVTETGGICLMDAARPTLRKQTQ